MTNFDMQRIENAVWTLLQYQDDIISRASDMKLEDYEIKNMFKTLYYVRGLAEKSVSRFGDCEDHGNAADVTVDQCVHQWTSYEWFDIKSLQKFRECRCDKCGVTHLEVL